MKKRIDFQMMRIVAIVFVIVNHTATNEYVSSAIYHSGISYYLYLFLAAFARVAVPIFFMVSGALLIKKEETIIAVLKKRVLKYVLIIVGFSVIQFSYHVAMGYASFSKTDIVLWLKNLYSNNVIVPYWFLYAYLGLMLMLPFLRKLAKNLSKKEFEYLIALHLIVFGVLQVMEFFVGLERINLDIPFACNTAIFYFLLGYYVDNFVSIQNKNLIILGVSSFVSIVVLTAMVYLQIRADGVFEQGTKYAFNSSLIVIPTVTIFMLIKRLFHENKKIVLKDWMKKWINCIGNAVFGVYLLETIFDTLTFDVYFIALKFVPPILAWIAWVLVDVTFGLVIVMLVRSVKMKLKKQGDTLWKRA